jgi:hypothetical protein
MYYARVLGLIEPPSVEVGDTAMYATLALCIASALALGAHCVAGAVRERSLVPVLALAGGVVALPIEPLWDVVVQFVFPFDTQPIAFTAYGRPIPLYLAFIYPAFIGWGSYVGYRMIKRGATRGQLLAVPVVFCLADAAIEIAGINAGVWLYYGEHSFTLFGWPLYFGVLNGSIPLLGGFLMVLLEQRLQRAARLALVFVVPTVYAGIYAAAGWPTWAALNADVPGSFVWLAGAATITITGGVCWLVVVASRSACSR